MASQDLTLQHHVRPIIAAIRTMGFPVPGPREETTPAVPFITISRQAGAGGMTLAQRLVERLNALENTELPWSAWDRELVEKVAADHQISAELIASLEESSYSWLQDLLGGFSLTDRPDLTDETRIYHRVAATIRALAQVGQAVIVGAGSVLVTHNMPGGIHLRLIAPLEHRVRNMAAQLGLSRDEALAHVQKQDRNREQFYRRHWPGHPLTDEDFTLTLNSAKLGENQMVECLLPLIAPAARK